MKPTHFAFAAILCLMPSIAQAQDKQPKAPEPIVIAGQLLDGDPIDALRKRPAKVHVLKLEKGKKYQIDLKSADFDAYLRIEDAAGANLAEDDDGGGGRDARLVFAPTKDDDYKIIATSFAGGSGNYTLNVKDLAANAVAKKPGGFVPPFGKFGFPAAVARGPVDLPAGTKIDTPTADKGVDIQGQLDANDPKDPIMRSPAKFYEVELKEGIAYQIDHLSGDFDAYLRLTDAQGRELARDDDGGGNLNARIHFIPTATATYKIVATVLGPKTGNFQFTAKELGKATKPDPAKVFEVGKKSTFIAAALSLQDAKDQIRTNSNCQIHQFKLSANKTYVVDMMSGVMDSYLRIEDSQGGNLAEDDDSGGGLNARISFRPPADGTFRVIATTVGGGVGPYILSIREE